MDARLVSGRGGWSVTTVRWFPERTVDSMLAIEVVQFIPEALVWSPTNTSGSVDHVVSAPDMWVLIFECKATVSDRARDPLRPWRSLIDYPQLDTYIRAGLPVHYALPTKPDSPSSPWFRQCGVEHCKACRNDAHPARRWAGTSHNVRSAPIHLRFQPWFAHWCWVIPAADLRPYLTALGQPLEPETAGRLLGRIPNADRLCHFLDKIANAKTASRAALTIDAGQLSGLIADLPLLAPSDQGNDSGTTGLQFVYLPSPSQV
jgi:hypothetical protein